MSESLEYRAKDGVFEAVYEVVKTAIVVKGDTTYRVEVLRGYSNPNVLYSTRCWEERDLDGKGTKVWVDCELAWTRGDNADIVLHQALGFLGEK